MTEVDSDAGVQVHTVPSKAVIRQHPIHPMLVVYPIALLSLVFVTDALHVWRDEDFWAFASFWLLAAGLAVGIVAGLVGMIDLLLIHEVRRHVSAWSHFIAAVMVLALAAAGVALRWSDPVAAVWPWGLFSSAVLFAMVVVAGWLGGTLTFRHAIGAYGREAAEAAGDDSAPPAE